MLRRIRRWFVDAEIKQLGDDLDKAADQVLTYGHKVEGMQMRLERLSNRVNMRLTRAGIPAARDEERSDDDILADIQRRAGNGGRSEYEFE